MELNEQKTNRNEDGTFKPGHSGLKKPGSTGRVSGEIKRKLIEFLNGELDSIKTLYDTVPPKNKLAFIAEILSYAIPKNRDVKIEDTTPGRYPIIDHSKLLNLPPDILKQILDATEYSGNGNEQQ